MGCWRSNVGELQLISSWNMTYGDVGASPLRVNLEA